MAGSFALKSLVLITISTILFSESLAIGSIKTSTFLSPSIELTPGLVSNKIYYDVGFPRGHVAVKNFAAELVDEEGNPVPLYETYLHHRLVMKYFQRKNTTFSAANVNEAAMKGDLIFSPINGLCQRGTLEYFWGLGSETRHTQTHLPDPFAVEIGNPDKIPSGYEEKWRINVHVIDTRAVVSRRGCLECRCDLYNVSAAPGYRGGVQCCDDNYRCMLNEGSNAESKRKVFLRYTVTWTDWEPSILPVKIYVLDVTDPGEGSPNCKIEYDVEGCRNPTIKGDNCVHRKETTLKIPSGGSVVFAFGHQHVGATDIALYKEDGSLICQSKPVYGNGTGPGNEMGYVVKMTSCYPQLGDVKLHDLESVTVVSKYSSVKMRIGAMGLFYLVVAG